MSLRIIARPQVDISSSLMEQLKSIQQHEAQVVLHFIYFSYNPRFVAINIEPTSVLIDDASLHKSELVYVENIPIAPDLKNVVIGNEYHFTLVFTALPNDTRLFHFVERHAVHPFEVYNIERNDTDVYFFSLW